MGSIGQIHLQPRGVTNWKLAMQPFAKLLWILVTTTTTTTGLCLTWLVNSRIGSLPIVNFGHCGGGFSSKVLKHRNLSD